MGTKRSTIIVGLLSFLALFAVACGGTTGPGSAGGPAGVPTPTPAAMPTPAPRVPPPKSDAAAFVTAGSLLYVPTTVTTERLIVRTANVALVVGDVQAAAEAVGRLAERLDGVVVSSSIRGDGDDRTAAVAIRVPVSRFEEALAKVRDLAVRVLSEDTSSQDVTEEYVDLDAQLRNLRATESQYLELLRRAEKVEEVLSVQRELSNVRAQIERLQARLQYLERTAAMSLITVYLSPTTSQKPLVKPGWSAAESLRSAFRGMVSVAQSLANALIRIVVFAPLWLPPVAVLLAVAYLWRRRRQRGP